MIFTKIYRSSLLALLWAFTLSSCTSHYYTEPGSPHPPCIIYLPEKIRVALVLGSGGIRGIAHVGVIEELKAAGIPIDLIVGCSAGSMVGALYADNLDIEKVKDIIWNVKTDSLLDFDFWNCRYGLSQGRSMKSALSKHLSAKTFDDLKIPLVIVACDLYSGELVPIGSGDLARAVQASCSIPLMFAPCQHKGRILIDGGVVNPVPAKVARDLGADIVIAVDLCELLPKTFPSNLFQIATRSAEIAFIWQNEICTHHGDIIIRPKTVGMGTFNDKRKWQIYEAGRRATREQIPVIKDLLAGINLSNHGDRKRAVTLHCYSPQICSEY
ncbi:patatin-like phospholipase family protein [Parachlamydia sp. AcF125]|uniref:patatin-like phospholipase family protein n=1 Tax=Parachlamydia sp. AcF125 TaxID=2795736 RepID=UPI001BD8FEAB|nr:patatin-like phospholipase family protein [Parachlamydia sp. AcF125]MBS4167380.1 putative NTE family protein [Parachlamydia sp. AcF125]